MKLHLTTDPSINLITGYGHGHVMINKERYEHDLIILPNQVLSWRTGHGGELAETDFEPLASLQPEVVLVGTGEHHLFLHPRLYARLSKSRIGVEVMNCGAACRTYNILVGEGRHVACALLLDET